MCVPYGSSKSRWKFTESYVTLIKSPRATLIACCRDVNLKVKINFIKRGKHTRLRHNGALA